MSSPTKDPIALTGHWHLDCRIESDLPEDNVIGTRFLINTIFAAVAFAGLLFTGWLGYLNLTTRHQTRDWERRIEENRAEVRDIQRMQREYAVESAKIDEAYKLVRPKLAVYDFLSNLGRSRPAQLVIDAVDWNDSGVVVRGIVHETSERASLLLGNYVKGLGKEEKMAAVFKEIRLTGFNRGATIDVMNFEIVFYFKPAKP